MINECLYLHFTSTVGGLTQSLGENTQIMYRAGSNGTG